jgi:hypothetical protein
MSQFFWLCFFFLGFYFSLVQFILPKMARILKYRQEKMLKIQTQSSSYVNFVSQIKEKRWMSYLACLEIQKSLAQAETIRGKETFEESWETLLALKSQDNLDPAFRYENEVFREHMVSQNSSIAYLSLMKKESPLFSTALTSYFFLENAY